jgi:hypothetical protein
MLLLRLGYDTEAEISELVKNWFFEEKKIWLFKKLIF